MAEAMKPAVKSIVEPTAGPPAPGPSWVRLRAAAPPKKLRTLALLTVPSRYFTAEAMRAHSSIWTLATSL